MKPFCEVIVSDILPAVRAMLTKELTQTHGLNQYQISEILGITQPAVSQYLKEVRGFRVKLLKKNKAIANEVKKLSAEIASGSLKGELINERFCLICKKVREEKIVCKLHKGVYPIIAQCNACLGEVCR